MNTHYYTTPLSLRLDRPALDEMPVEKPRFSRVFWISWTLAKLIFRYSNSRLSRGITPQQRAVEIRQFLERLGGIWIKVGQVVAMRTDLFPVEFCSELARLQDRAITFPAETARAIVEANLREPLEEVFEEFEAAPFAAASLCQVHRARLRKTGVQVVVKVQRPHAWDYFHYDFRWLRFFARVLRFFGIMKRMRLDTMLQQIREMMEEELDYRHEASNMRRFRETLKVHRIIVPRVFLRYSTEKILVMEYLDGVFMSEFISVMRRDPERAARWLDENGIEPRRIARRLFQSVMRQLYEDLFFHADLHPGNVVLLRDNRLAFIDFGNCGRVDKKFAAQYDQYFRAMSENAFDKAVDLLLLTLGKLPPMDVDEFKKRVIKVLERQVTRSHIKNLPYREKSIGSNSAELNQIMAEYEIEINWEMLKMARAFESVDQNISVLNPEFNFTREMQRYQMSAAKRRKQLQFRNLPGMVDQIADFAQIILPSIIQRSSTFGGSVGKGIQLVAAFLNLVKTGLVLTLVAMAWIYLYQHHYKVVDQLHDESGDLLTEVGVTELVKQVPKAEEEAWLLKGAVVVFVIYHLGKFIRNLLKPDPRAARG